MLGSRSVSNNVEHIIVLSGCIFLSVNFFFAYWMHL